LLGLGDDTADGAAGAAFVFAGLSLVVLLLLGNGQFGAKPDWTGLQWRRLSEIYPLEMGASLYDSIEPADVFQGELGDCYFLAALSCLAERPVVTLPPVTLAPVTLQS
jgi:hypothetical protein